MSLLRTLNSALSEMNIEQKDEPLVELARVYAERIDFTQSSDAHKVVKELGPELMKVLAELLMTPKARAAITQQVKEVASDEPESATFSNARAAAAARNSGAYSA